MIRTTPIAATSTKSRSGAATACGSSLLYAGNSLDKARRVFERTHKDVLDEWPRNQTIL